MKFIGSVSVEKWNDLILLAIYIFLKLRSLKICLKTQYAATTYSLEINQPPDVRRRGDALSNTIDCDNLQKPFVII